MRNSCSYEQKKKKATVIAFYLPQYYPIPDNDRWWGKGFTEWTNVGKAKRYFPGHYQPRVPADLGYYDLRVPEVREAQATLANEAGVDAFCYWHYWFGNGKQLLEKPLQEVLATGKPNFPFCLGWANHDWSKKNWNKDVSRFTNAFLIRQEYPGIDDIDNHFRTMLPAFKDKRYFRLDGKQLFYIYAPESMPNLDFFISRWQELAHQQGLPGFFFVGGCTDLNKVNSSPFLQCDAVALDLKGKAFIGGGRRLWRRLSYLLPLPTNVVKYSYAIKKMVDPCYRDERIFPTIYPNWDHSPRVGRSGTIMHGSSPELFKKFVKTTLSLIETKVPERKVIFLKSWNEWAEGNYMEPDLKFGKRYIEALKECLVI